MQGEGVGGGVERREMRRETGGAERCYKWREQHGQSHGWGRGMHSLRTKKREDKLVKFTFPGAFKMKSILQKIPAEDAGFFPLFFLQVYTFATFMHTKIINCKLIIHWPWTLE